MINANRKITTMAVVALTVGPLGSEVAAEDQKWGFKLGFFVTELSTETQLESNIQNIRQEIDFEDDLGLDSSNSVFRLDGYYKIKDRHRIDYSYYDLSRSGSGILETEIYFRDQIFTVDTLVDTDFDLNIYKLAYTYSWLNQESYYLGFSAGLYALDFDLGLRSIDRPLQAGRAKLVAPLPVFGFRGEYELSEKWTLEGSGEFFALEYEDYKGRVIDVFLGFDYQITSNTALGLAYNYVELEVETDQAKGVGAFDWNYAGALLYLKFDF